ncbi:hypothetical protein [Aequorivita echinoideorum]|uniref:ABC-transporter type IV n=1 Tax=Aequorivita echinoideorum TaxID=1549647 RepID=A0ABS5S328_9FLAO|nr:hypothetical protein [Aequorivita echinoideorum]MBT0607603.1 hypothetical protein [Aequorivita echinoideorum]
MKKYITAKFREIEGVLYAVYIFTYLGAGVIMNTIGQSLEIAKFQHWWQIITCYGLYMIPISILLRGHSFFNQYCYGLLAMGLLEFSGYALETSYVFPDNILVQWFGPYTFALCMTLFFAIYFPLGNMVVNFVYNRLLQIKKPLQ